MRGGHARPGSGYFFEPAILVDAAADMRVPQEEIFAPALMVTPFDDDASPAAVAALRAFGQALARDLGTVHALAGLLDSGQVIVNAGGGTATLPFGV